MEIQNWPFCTSFGHGGGRECLAEKQDVLLERDGALSDPPTPHTLLIPRCEGDTVATLRFVCDYRLDTCTDVASVKFYLGEAVQLPEKAPNIATISTTRGNIDGVPAKYGTIGVYEHNLTASELYGFLNVTSLTPGLDYVFWSVWGHENASFGPESNTRDFDLARTQYW